MQRTVTGVGKGRAGGWWLDLDCLHRRLIPHAPDGPSAPSGLGAAVDCQLCDQLMLPDGLELARTTRQFDAATTPAGLLRQHRVAEGVWGVLEMGRGSVKFRIHGDQPATRTLRQGDRQPIPPGVDHDVAPDSAAQFRIEFWHRPSASADD